MKNYITPEISIIELEIEDAVLAGSDNGFELPAFSAGGDI